MDSSWSVGASAAVSVPLLSLSLNAALSAAVMLNMQCCATAELLSMPMSCSFSISSWLAMAAVTIYLGPPGFKAAGYLEAAKAFSGHQSWVSLDRCVSLDGRCSRFAAQVASASVG
jgi:hypothetical protein